jgi:hypothetical protein
MRKILTAAFLLAAAAVALGQTPSVGKYKVTGGNTMRSEADRWNDSWTSAPEIGVDCTNVNDSTTAIQNWTNAHRTGGRLNFPWGCQFFTTATITITDGVNIMFTSTQTPGGGSGAPARWNWKGTNGGAACATNFASCQYVIDFEAIDHPVVEGIAFNSPGGSNCPDGYLKFDGNPTTHIGTGGLIRRNSFGNGNCANANFVAVNISPTATNNHENYVVEDNGAFCSNVTFHSRGNAGVTTSGSATVTASNAPFVAGDVGSRIRLSFDNPSNPFNNVGTVGPPSRGFFDTTITGFTNASTITVAAPVNFTANPVNIYVGGSLGIAYRNGHSQNAIQQYFKNLQYTECQFGVYVSGGGVQMIGISGGQSDVGVYTDGFIAQNTTLDYYASESDYVAVIQQNGAGPPFEISNSRFSNGNQAGNGFLQIAGAVLRNNLVNFGLPNSNSVFFAPYQPVGVVGLGTITGGSGYVNGTYTTVTLRNYGTAGLDSDNANCILHNATLVVSGGAVTSVTLGQVMCRWGTPPGGVLVANNSDLGGSGSGFSVPITALATEPILNSQTDYWGTFFSHNNNWSPGCCFTGMTWANFGFNQFVAPPVTQIDDNMPDVSGNLPGRKILPCQTGGTSCLNVTFNAPGTGTQPYGVGVLASVGPAIVSMGDAIVFRATGGGGTTYEGFQAFAPQGLASGGTTFSGFEANWAGQATFQASAPGAPITAAYGFRARTPSAWGGGGTNLPVLYGFECDQQKAYSQIVTAYCFYNANSSDWNLFAGPVILKPTTVSALPTCNAALDGARMFVTDQATAIAYRGAVTGGGANHQAVLCANSAWIQD